MTIHTHAQTPIQRYAYSLDEAAASLDLSRGGVYALIHAGKLRTVKIGRRVLVPTDELQRLVEVA